MTGPTSTPIFPIPTITSMVLDGKECEITGTNLSSKQTVYFGVTSLETEWRSVTQLNCKIPNEDGHSLFEQSVIKADGSKIVVPVTIVRDDGVLYKTSFNCHYTKTTDGKTLFEVNEKEN
uniref:TIG_SUH domain-containing protein n=1 Tax=Panagrellus redivivus TaxID=6233 RepID=A0A7E4VFW3_PANRE